MLPTPDALALPGVMAHLKRHTQPWHDRLEAHPRLGALLRDDLTLTAYAALLARLHGFYAPLEAGLRPDAGWALQGFDLDARRKTPWLHRDLHALGFAPAQVAALPQCRALPPHATPAQTLGCVYVLEGATLGGRIIARHLRRTLGLTPENGAAFYNGYQEDVGPRWKALCLFLETTLSDAALPEATEAAAQTFSGLHTWLAG